MRIKNLNDRASIQNKPPKPDITVWKGGHKAENRIGANLKNQLRIEVSGYSKGVIKKYYHDCKENGDSLLVESLNIIPAYSDELKTLTSQMIAFKGNKIQSLCDRETIFTEFVETKNEFGDIYRSPKESSHPCPVAGTNHKCPRGCTLNGDFYFYILELVLEGSSQLCRIKTHSIQDNIAIAQILDEVKEEIGDIKKSPFTSEETRSYVVYRLGRKEIPLSRPKMEQGKRTGNRFISPDWALSLELHPIWKNKYFNWLQYEQLHQRAIAPSVRLLEGIYGEKVLTPGEQNKVASTALRAQVPKGIHFAIASSKLNTNHLETLNGDQKSSEKPLATSYSLLATSKSSSWDHYRDRLAIAYKTNNWNQEEFQELLRSHFGKENVDESWAIDKLETLLELIKKS